MNSPNPQAETWTQSPAHNTKAPPGSVTRTAFIVTDPVSSVDGEGRPVPPPPVPCSSVLPQYPGFLEPGQAGSGLDHQPRPHLTGTIVKYILTGVIDVEVLTDPAAVVAALDPVRGKVLAALAEPGSATIVAAELGLKRQMVNYHLRTLEAHGLVQLIEERPRRGLLERVVQASARSYAASPDVFGDTAADPRRTDRLSSSYLIAVAARMVHEVAELVRSADRVGKSLPTLAIDTEIRFGSAADRAAFTHELADTVSSLVSRYHDETATGGRWHRLVVAAHPRPATPRKEKR